MKSSDSIEFSLFFIRSKKISRTVKKKERSLKKTFHVHCLLNWLHLLSAGHFELGGASFAIQSTTFLTLISFNSLFVTPNRDCQRLQKVRVVDLEINLLFLLSFTETPSSSLSRKWCKLRQRCASFHAMKLDCTATDGPTSLPYQFYDNGLPSASPGPQNFILAHEQRVIMVNGKPKVFAVIDNRSGSRNGYYAGNFPMPCEPIVEHQPIKICKCKSRISASSSALNYDITDPQLMHVLSQQSRLQYFDGEDVKAKPKTRRLSLFGSERKSKKETTKNFDLKQFKSVSMRCHHHTQHMMYIREQQMLMQQQEAQQAKDTIKSSKFSTVGRKKRSLYEVFFSSNKSPPASESGIRQPTFYVPLPGAAESDGLAHQPPKHQHRANSVNPTRSIRSRSVCATDSTNNVRTIFRNVETPQATSERRKSNSFNPRESLEITSFLFNKLRLDRSGDGGSKCSTFTGTRRESSDGRCDEKVVTNVSNKII